MRASILVFVLIISTALFAQSPATAPAKGDAAGIDAIIELVKAKTPESMVLKSVQKEGKTYDLAPADMLKLRKAGVSDKIIEAMMDPASTTAAGTSGSAEATAKAAPAKQPEKEKKSGGLFGSIKDTLKGNAQKTVDGVESTTNSTVDKTVEGTQNKANAAVDDAVGNTADKATGKATDKANTAASKATSSTSTRKK